MRFLSLFLTLLLLANLSAPAFVFAQKKPYKIEELEEVIKSGISDKKIEELLYENGLSFYPDDEAIARLKRARASDKVIEAVRAAEHPPPPREGPYTLEDLVTSIKSGIPSEDYLIESLNQVGLSFYPDEEAIDRLKQAGASDEVIKAVLSAKHPPKPVLVKEEKPIYKRWWFLGAAAVVAGGTVVALWPKEKKEKDLPGFPPYPTGKK